MAQGEPKSVADYREVVKILKLKIIKQQKTIQSLQLQISTAEQLTNSALLKEADEDIKDTKDIHTPEFDMDKPKGKVQVMLNLLTGIKKLGITPQSIFRIADFSYKNHVEADYFRTVISRMNLDLTPKEISCLIFIFDENCTGYISREQYEQALHSYKLAVEVSYLPYLQECLVKLSSLLKDKASIAKLYGQMEQLAKSKNEVDLNVFSETIKQVYGERLQEKEIVGAFHGIDLESQGHLERNNFMYCITSFFNKADWKDPQKSSLQKSILNGIMKIEPSPEESRYAPNAPNAPNLPKESKSPLSTLASQYQIQLPDLYSELSSLNWKARMTMNSFKKSVFGLNRAVPTVLISQIFKEIDSQHRGSVHLAELINYALANHADVDTIFRLVGKYFSVNDLNGETFLFMFGLNADGEISKVKFIETMKKTFETQQGWESFWEKLEKGRGPMPVSQMIKMLQKYEEHAE